jgi:predicted heme/steroid binding protein
MTVAELKKYNGQNGNPAYVAYKGVIYDVTNAKKWKNGKHENGVVAGVDLTSAMGDAPHGTEVLNGLPVIGKLK